MIAWESSSWEEVPNIKIYLYPPAGDRTKPTETERFPHAYIENVKQQIREMIDRDRNHPSIIIWGFADDLSLYHYPEDFTDLTNFTHSLDNTRWTAGRVPPNVTDIVDATATPELVKYHSEHPDGKYIWNEWGAFASERGREGAPFYDKLPADPGSEVSMSDSDAALLLEAYSMQWAAIPWLGTVKWCMFDTGELNAVQTQSLWTRHHEDKVTLRWPFNDYYGIADMWRLPKEGYYLLQSQWTGKAHGPYRGPLDANHQARREANGAGLQQCGLSRVIAERPQPRRTPVGITRPRLARLPRFLRSVPNAGRVQQPTAPRSQAQARPLHLG